MKLFTAIKNALNKYLRLFTFWNFQKDFRKRDKLNLIVVLIVNIANSLTKIIAPAAFAKAIEMLAVSEDSYKVSSFDFSAKNLLYISAVLTALSKSEVHFKRILLSKVDDHLIKKNSIKIIEMEHSIPLEIHSLLRMEITKSLMEVINTQARLTSEMIIVVYQGLFDILLGSLLIWSLYGNMIGSGFLLYCALDFFLLNNLITFLTRQTVFFEKMNHVLNKLINREFDILNFEETIRMFSHERFEQELSGHLIDKYLVAKNRFQLSDNFASVLKLIPYTVASIMPISFMLKDTNSVDDLDHFIFLVSYINTFGANVLGVSQSLKSCMRAIESFDKVQKLLTDNSTPPVPGDQLALPAFISPNAFASPEIQFDDVSFTYPNAIQPTLKGISFTLAPGKKLGIVGRSNAGKSTLTKLLYGFYKPQSGTIKINGIHIHQIPRDALLRMLCCVPQYFEFFKDKSLKYNVLYGNSSNLFLKQYLEFEKSQNDDVLPPNAMPLNINQEEEQYLLANEKPKDVFADVMRKVKLSNLVDENAAKKLSQRPLSGGQKQRLNIARALVRNSSIFIFDEATASLDSFTESEVLQNIKECTRTKSVMMITHRLSTIMDADKVIVLEEGKIIEEGSPKALLEKQGLFYDYWQTQQMH